MKNYPTGISVLILISLSACKNYSAIDNQKPSQKKEVVLFNAENPQNWNVFLDSSDNETEKTFTFDKGVIKCSGKPNGYLRTSSGFSDYILTLEWRWPEGPGNSGVFLHLAPEDNIWPDALECQLMSGSAGDFIAMGTIDFNERSNKDERVVKKYEDTSESPAGEWNTYRIICKTDSVLVYVNDILQNQATGLNRKHGAIGLQSEGTPIEFRNVIIKEL